MKYRKKSILLLCVIFLVISGVMYELAGITKKAITSERMTAAKTVEIGFSEGLAETFGNMNYASQLSYTIDLDNTADLNLFKKSVQKLTDENEHVLYAAYYNDDTLDYIYPADRFSSFLGKDMADFSYCITLAKVVMEPVIEGPAKLFDEKEDVFLFIQPVYVGTTYIGEIVVAVDDDYVLSSLGLKELEDADYDYELWRVDFLGQSKIVIASSDSSVDFSDAVKQQFSLPATWSISILPKGGWITRTENICIYIAFIVLGLVILGIGLLLYDNFSLRKKLETAKYTNLSTGLSTIEGFSFFLNKHISKTPDVPAYILNLQLGNFRRFTKDMEQDEITKYLMQFKQSITECLTKDAIVTRVNDDSFLIAFFTNKRNPDDIIEEFVLQLHWKRRIDQTKVFITPRYCTVTYPEHGKDAVSLMNAARRQFREKY
ncbi:diguanylate cyclase [Clostridium sp. AF19-22AC]|jgi:GGDEF domain-containing protein|uniref:diguanylate cyclase domain-containing protein n=1 Tax=Clostridia TaxID=186801 RepID=UPI000E525FA5|nr:MULTISPECIES: diguanylate cyclase [Clostridia]RHR21636.1 diguanylate cyclase [Clostridium sp. AF19-22AC]